MRELALHLLDLAQNSIEAGAQLVCIHLVLDDDGLLRMRMQDDGCGMSQAMQDQVLSPFCTSRATRKTGFGIPLARENALRTGGSFDLVSTPGQGTCLNLAFHTRHIDCPPLGKLADSLASLVLGNPHQPDYYLELQSPNGNQTLDTRAIKQMIAPLTLNTPEIATWLLTQIQNITAQCFGGMGL